MKGGLGVKDDADLESKWVRNTIRKQGNRKWYWGQWILKMQPY